MFKITWLDVDKVSLVTSDKTPAVPKATTKFSFFKMLISKKIDKEKLEKLEKIQKKLKGE